MEKRAYIVSNDLYRDHANRYYARKVRHGGGGGGRRRRSSSKCPPFPPTLQPRILLPFSPQMVPISGHDV